MNFSCFRKVFHPFILVIVVLISIALVFGAFSIKAQSREEFVPGEVLVKFKDNTSSAVINQELRRYKASVKETIPKIGVMAISVPEVAAPKVAEALSRNPNVEFAELNYLYYTLFTPDDAYFTGNQWGLENIGQIIKGQTGTSDADIDGPEAWEVTQGSGVKVAILDTGIDQDHEDLSGKIVDNKNFTSSSTADDLYGHGTHVGGIVAAITNNSKGVAGGCPSCSLMNVKVLNDSGAGANLWIANGIVYAADQGAKVINMSLGSSVKSLTLERAVNYAWNKGVVVVAAAGNSANPSKTYPGAYSNVIAVAATNNKDIKASFSSYGAKWVDVAAPGENIFSTFPNHSYTINKSFNYDYGSGTSMATPMVSAAAGLVWSTSYGTSASSVRARLEGTADKIPGTGSYWSAGRINAAKAVSP